MDQYTLHLCLVKRDMTKSTADSLPVHNKKLAYTYPTKPDSVILKHKSEDECRRLQDEGSLPQNEVDLGETKTPPAVVNIYPYS